MTVMRKNPKMIQKVKEGFMVEVIFKFGLELTIILKHWKHCGCP